MDNHFIMRLIPLACGGMMLFGSLGQLFNETVGICGAIVGFCFGSWLAWYGNK